MKTNLPHLTLVCLVLSFPLVLFGHSLSIPNIVFATGEKIIVNYSGFQGAVNDWISDAAKGLADDKYTLWQYTGGEPVAPRHLTACLQRTMNYGVISTMKILCVRENLNLTPVKLRLKGKNNLLLNAD